LSKSGENNRQSQKTVPILADSSRHGLGNGLGSGDSERAGNISEEMMPVEDDPTVADLGSNAPER